MADYEAILRQYEAENRKREIPRHHSEEGLTDLCLNDYMGLARHALEWKEEFQRRFGDAAMSASASRLLASDQNIFNSLESILGKLYGRPALLFNSGYHANTGIIQALNIEGTLWLTDKLIHASAIDGIRMVGAEFKRWNHNDISHLERLIEKHHDQFDRLIVVCESLYSMDGDKAPLKEIAALKRKYPKVMLYVDEAHAFGVFGNRGEGLCKEEGILDEVDVIVGTLGKACASTGAFAITSPLIHDFLVNNARSLIFSTALPPACAAWSLLMIEKLMEMQTERLHLREISERFRKGIERITGTANPSSSAIVPLLTGDSANAIELSRALENHGVLALPIRRPTVPPGGERIRFSLNADLSVEDIDRLLEVISKVYERLS